MSNIKQSAKKVNKEVLLEKLESLDDRILNIWLEDQSTMTDDERWDIFVSLLETRVSLLKTCCDAGLKLTPDQVVPRWLERLSSSRCTLKRRELRLLDEERKTRRQIGVYANVAQVAEGVDP